MINLFEEYNTEAMDLEYSLKSSGLNAQTIVLKDNGYLPEEIESPFKFFTQGAASSKQHLPLFFNELELPVHWEVHGTNSGAEIFEGYKQRGKINYSQRKGDFRLIQSVEWWNDQEKRRAVDLYNQYGQRFGHQTYSDGRLTLTTYYDREGREVVLHNHVAGTLQVYYQNQLYIFDNYSSFVLFYFEVAQLDTRRIHYNSLGTPYFITLDLAKAHPEISYAHTLFWQETSTAMPGNMKGLMQKGDQASTRQIIVQNKAEFERLRAQVDFATSVSMDYLGWLYPYRAHEAFKPSVFVLTNSDQVAHLHTLSEGLPEYQFHIAARTEMSSKLMNFGARPNVNLYPNVTTEELDGLLQSCSVYLDINHGGEVEQIIRQSFEHEQVIMAFRETLHNPRFVSPSFVFESQDVEVMLESLRDLLDSKAKFKQKLKAQKEHAGQESISRYKKVLEHA